MNYIDVMKQALEALPYGFDAARCDYAFKLSQKAEQALRAAIEQMEKQEPVVWGIDWSTTGDKSCCTIVKKLPDGAMEVVASEYSPEPGVPEGKFKLGDRVTKTGGSSWTGLVVGFYSTSLTLEGYAVESETEKGSVQIYPAKALTAAPEYKP